MRLATTLVTIALATNVGLAQEPTDLEPQKGGTVYSLGTLGQAAFASNVAQRIPPVVSRFSARTTLQDPLNAIAEDSGGTAFFGSDMSMGFRDVLHDSRLRYVLGFNMPESSDDDESRWHEIKVEVNREDVDVRARPGFFWPRR